VGTLLNGCMKVCIYIFATVPDAYIYIFMRMKDVLIKMRDICLSF